MDDVQSRIEDNFHLKQNRVNRRECKYQIYNYMFNYHQKRVIATVITKTLLPSIARCLAHRARAI